MQHASKYSFREALIKLAGTVADKFFKAAEKQILQDGSTPFDVIETFLKGYAKGDGAGNAHVQAELADAVKRVEAKYGRAKEKYSPYGAYSRGAGAGAGAGGGYSRARGPTPGGAYRSPWEDFADEVRRQTRKSNEDWNAAQSKRDAAWAAEEAELYAARAKTRNAERAAEEAAKKRTGYNEWGFNDKGQHTSTQQLKARARAAILLGVPIGALVGVSALRSAAAKKARQSRIRWGAGTAAAAGASGLAGLAAYRKSEGKQKAAGLGSAFLHPFKSIETAQLKKVDPFLAALDVGSAGALLGGTAGAAVHEVFPSKARKALSALEYEAIDRAHSFRGRPGSFTEADVQDLQRVAGAARRRQEKGLIATIVAPAVLGGGALGALGWKGAKIGNKNIDDARKALALHAAGMLGTGVAATGGLVYALTRKDRK